MTLHPSRIRPFVVALWVAAPSFLGAAASRAEPARIITPEEAASVTCFGMGAYGGDVFATHLTGRCEGGRCVVTSDLYHVGLTGKEKRVARLIRWVGDHEPTVAELAAAASPSEIAKGQRAMKDARACRKAVPGARITLREHPSEVSAATIEERWDGRWVLRSDSGWSVTLREGIDAVFWSETSNMLTLHRGSRDSWEHIFVTSSYDVFGRAPPRAPAPAAIPLTLDNAGKGLCHGWDPKRHLPIVGDVRVAPGVTSVRLGPLGAWSSPVEVRPPDDPALPPLANIRPEELAMLNDVLADATMPCTITSLPLDGAVSIASSAGPVSATLARGGGVVSLLLTGPKGARVAIDLKDDVERVALYSTTGAETESWRLAVPRDDGLVNHQPIDLKLLFGTVDGPNVPQSPDVLAATPRRFGTTPTTLPASRPSLRRCMGWSKTTRTVFVASPRSYQSSNIGGSSRGEATVLVAIGPSGSTDKVTVGKEEPWPKSVELADRVLAQADVGCLEGTELVVLGKRLVVSVTGREVAISDGTTRQPLASLAHEPMPPGSSQEFERSGTVETLAAVFWHPETAALVLEIDVVEEHAEGDMGGSTHSTPRYVWVDLSRLLK